MYAAILMVVAVVTQPGARVYVWERKYKEPSNMAETVWQGSTGDFNSAGNWSNGVPSSSNTPAIADGTSQQDMTTNLDRTGGTAFEFITTPDYKGDIGGAGNPLILYAVSGGKSATIRGTGTTYLTVGAVAVGTDIIIDCRRGTVVLDTESGTTISRLLVKSGNLTIASTCQANGRCVMSGNQINATIVERDSTESPPLYWIVQGATVTNNRTYPASAAYLILLNGSVTQTGVIDALTNIIIAGGTFAYEPINDPSGDSFSAVVVGGVLDSTGYTGSISYSPLLVGPTGHVMGTIIDTGPGTTDYDMRNPYP